MRIVLGHLKTGSDPGAVLRHQDAIRALICVSSKNPSISSAGLAWLQGIEMEPVLAGELQFHKPRAEPREVVRALSWVMSLAGPCVLAFDQLDPIVHQVARQNVNGDSSEQRTARGIIDQIGNGLAALRETTLKTLVIVSCLEASYRVLAREVLASNLDRFHPPTRLQNPGMTHYQTLIEARLAPHYQEAGFAPPYPSWPFTRDAIRGLKGQSPRRVLQLCEQYRRHCADVGQVEELASFSDIPQHPGGRKPSRDLDHLDREFQKLRGEADLNAILSETTEDTALAPLYQNALQCLIDENLDHLPVHIHASVQQAFGGSKKFIPLHARLRLVFHNEGDREEHFSVRVLLKKNAASYKSRLKLAMTESGIDVNLPFRRLTIVRRGDIPGGAETKRETNRFLDQGGRFHHPDDDELRTLFALAKLAERNDPDWPGWLLETKPISTLKLGHVLAPGSVLVTDQAGAEAR